LSVIHKAMSCRSSWILCTSCLACWLLKMADRVPCYVCMFWPANVKYSVVCLPQCCLYCYYCTVPLFTVRCSPVADWCTVNVKCSVVCLPERCLYCYYCTVPLFTVRCSPGADWCPVNDSCKIVFVTCVTICPARSSCLLSMLLSFVLYC